MNNKRKLTKSVTVALLVALASLATAGLVLADHYGPVEGVPVSSKTYFDQYQAAIDHTEENAAAALARSINLREFSYVPYPDEFDQTFLDNVTPHRSISSEVKNLVELGKWGRLSELFASLQAASTENSQSQYVPYPDEFDQTWLDNFTPRGSISAAQDVFENGNWGRLSELHEPLQGAGR
jgi:hypothetical protein